MRQFKFDILSKGIRKGEEVAKTVRVMNEKEEVE